MSRWSASDVGFRPLTAEDLPLVFDWLGRKHVRRWWGDRAAYDEAVAEYAKVEDPDVYPRLSHAIALVNIGRIDEARDVVRGALANTPDFTQAMWREGSFYSDPGILDGEIAALAEAGLPGS